MRRYFRILEDAGCPTHHLRLPASTGHQRITDHTLLAECISLPYRFVTRAYNEATVSDSNPFARKVIHERDKLWAKGIEMHFASARRNGDRVQTRLLFGCEKAPHL